MNDNETPATKPANVTLADLTDDEREALTPAQREALQRAERGELPVDYRSPAYNDPASVNFVHSMDPDAEAKGGPTDTVPDELLTTQTGEHGLVTSYSGDVVVDERILGAGTEPDGEFSGQFSQPPADGSHAPDEGVQSDGSPTSGPAAPVDGEGAAFDGGNGDGTSPHVLDDADEDPDVETGPMPALDEANDGSHETDNA